ncbi:hypothetical protein C900_01559 [Fulvivirga imtechensis AK7]|uniref:Uncharacterized protein n=1 Tax=Fulvivirga imtechensis AK7 TaxID=1237149 RepID=L8JW29_9BACT|nr:hypothetical protein [Fulvivirga imtechensis]ELR72403.1 hypothetical protein C900_01559 [Fulvivirga imtechensis AK7]
MQLLGIIRNRKIYHVQTRNNPDWSKLLPKSNWIALTVAHEGDEELIPIVANACLDRNASYICCSGELSKLSEEYFDEEIAWSAVEVPSILETSPITTSHHNLEEGFWFASTIADTDRYTVDTVVCIDLTEVKVKDLLCKLIEQINIGWIPPD